MEARNPRSWWVVLASVIVAAPGCELIHVRPQSHDPPAPEPDTTPVVVRFPLASQPAHDPLERRVLEFVDRIDRAARASDHRPPRTTALAADTQRPTPPTRSQPQSAPSAADDDAAHDASLAGPPAPSDDPATPADPPPETDSASPAHTESTPPAVRLLGARAATPPATQSPPAPTAGANAPARAATRTATLRELVSSWLTDSPADASFRAQLDARLLHVATGDYAAAREPLSLASSEQVELASALIEAMIAVREGHLGDPAGAQAAALRQIDRLSSTLRRGAEFELAQLVLCSEVRTFGQYQPIQPPRFPAGVPNEFVVYCEPRNFASEEHNGQRESRFSMRTRVLRGPEVILDLLDPEIVDRCRSQRRDCFIAKLVTLPAQLSPGDYTVKVTLEDRLKEQVAERHAEFRVIAAP